MLNIILHVPDSLLILKYKINFVHDRFVHEGINNSRHINLSFYLVRLKLVQIFVSPQIYRTFH